jgi:hypothetical protein
MEEKNIWVLPTNKPSRLWINDITGKIELSHSSDVYGALNIYITSDEQIKELDFIYDIEDKEICFVRDKDYLLNISRLAKNRCKKIILTTDQDLIKDWIQCIGEKFLQWFLMNPNCEFVSTNKVFEEHWSEESGAFEISYYKIIIPQEEPKQELLKQYPLTPEECFKKEPKQQTYIQSETMVVGMGYTSEDGSTKFVTKQETLEEAAERILLGEDLDLSDYDKRHILKAMLSIANWQQEQDKKMYSEEEVLNIIALYVKDEPHYTKKWFEQHKKK